MTGSIALDVVIGLVFIYTLYSLLTTTLTELIASAFRFRPKFLEKGIRRMLDDGSGTQIFSQAFFDKPLIKYLASKDGVRPSYIAARNFSKNLMDVLKSRGTPIVNNADASDAQRIRGILDNPGALGGSDTIDFIKSLMDDAQNDLGKFKALLEQWYDDTMERVSTWYKRRMQLVTFIIGFIVAGVFNVDTIKIVKALSSDPEKRAQFVAMAQELAKNEDARKIAYGTNDSTKLYEDFQKLRTEAFKANAVLAIDREKNAQCKTIYFTWSGVFGWLITAVALSLGSPFWFDLLNKLVKLRTSSQPTAEKEDKGQATTTSGVPFDKRVG